MQYIFVRSIYTTCCTKHVVLVPSSTTSYSTWATSTGYESILNIPGVVRGESELTSNSMRLIEHGISIHVSGQPSNIELRFLLKCRVSPFLGMHLPISPK